MTNKVDISVMNSFPVGNNKTYVLGKSNEGDVYFMNLTGDYDFKYDQKLRVVFTRVGKKLFGTAKELQGINSIKKI